MERWESQVDGDNEILMWDDSTKKIKDLEIGDEIWTINASHPNFGGSHIEHNKGEKGILWRKDYKGTIPQNLVKITFVDGTFVGVSSDYMLQGGYPSSGAQVWNIDDWITNYIDTNHKDTDKQNRDKIIYSLVANIDFQHMGIHPQAKDWWDSSISGSLHPSGRQSGSVPGRIIRGKFIACNWNKSEQPKKEIVSTELYTAKAYTIGVACGHYVMINDTVCWCTTNGFVWPEKWYRKNCPEHWSLDSKGMGGGIEDADRQRISEFL